MSATSTTLLRRAQSADPAAWNELVHKYAGAVYVWCRRRGVPQTDSADVVQDVLAAVAVALDRYRHDRDSDTFRGWLREIAENKIHDYYRRAEHQVGVAEGGSAACQRLEEHPAPGERGGEASDNRAWPELPTTDPELERLRLGINPRDWSICWELVSGAADARELAARHGIRLSHIYVIKSRVLKRLRERHEALSHAIQGGTVDRAGLS